MSEELKRLTLQAVDRYFSNKPFTITEINTYLNEVAKCFGDKEASGFINEVLETIKKYGYTNPAESFGLAFVVTVAEFALHIDRKQNSDKNGEKL